MSTLKVLGVHGIGHQESREEWEPQWTDVIQQGIAHWSQEIVAQTTFVNYDDIFGSAAMTPQGTVAGVGKLLLNGFIYGLGDAFRPRRGFDEISEKIKWYAGMITQWAEDENLRKKCRERLLKAITETNPDLVCAHSLGTLITCDLLVHPPEQAGSLEFKLVTFGSQIGNPTVRGMFGGRITEIGPAFWYNLYNEQDQVFVVSLRVPSPDYLQVDTPSPSGHDAIGYLTHPNTVARVWREIAAGHPERRALTRRSLTSAPAEQAKVAGERRALLIGINDYPDPKNRLEGCVNDTFLISSVLQECGFPPDSIRLVLNERATAAGIRDRMEWLLADPRPCDIRFLFSSGHGAQIPGYGPGDTVDRLDECLVPYDFRLDAKHRLHGR